MPALELTLPQIARQEADGTINFNAGGISTIATSPQSFMIFYLTQEDEQNGYGTVIQLDEQHQAFIYPDLNPEYTYLFYKNEQAQIQTLLWCIEFATRTTDGLYVTQAKVHGRGVTEEDMQRFNQIMLTPPTAPQSQHSLTETYVPAQQSSASQPTATEPAVAEPTIQPILDTTTTPTVASQPDLLAPIPSDTATMPLSEPQTPQSTPQTVVTAPETPAAQPMPVMSFPDLPPLPSLPPQPAAAPTPSQPTYVQPEPQTAFAPVLETAPVPESASTASTNQTQLSEEQAAKNPVGRPPKPLLSDAAWNVDQADFAWAKSISRESITGYQDILRQKIQQQIQRNQPELLNNPGFTPAFNQAFAAICQTYELTPTARQDILKSLLNGRIIENLSKSLPS